MSNQKTIGADDFGRFNSLLASLLTSGASLAEALHQAASAAHNTSTQKEIQGIRDDVEHGTPFDKAVEQRLNFFPSTYVAMVRAGLRSGDLPKILGLVMQSSTRVNQVKKELVKLFIYPALVLTMLTVFVGIATFFTIPAAQDFFMRTGFESPLTALAVISLLRIYCVCLFCFLLLLVFVVIRALIKGARGMQAQLLPPALYRRVPFLGKYVDRWLTCIFLNEFAALLHSGISMVPALELCARSLDITSAQNELLNAADRISRGQDATQALRSVRFLPATIPLLFRPSATDNELRGYLEQAASNYEEEMKIYGAGFRHAFEMSVLLFLGLLVGSAVVSLWSIFLFLGNAANH